MLSGVHVLPPHFAGLRMLLMFNVSLHIAKCLRFYRLEMARNILKNIPYDRYNVEIGTHSARKKDEGWNHVFFVDVFFFFHSNWNILSGSMFVYIPKKKKEERKKIHAAQFYRRISRKTRKLFIDFCFILFI